MEEKNTETKVIVKEVSLEEEMIVIIGDPAIYGRIHTIKVQCPDCYVDLVNTRTRKTEKRLKAWGVNIIRGMMFKRDAVCGICGKVCFPEYR